MTNLQTRKAEIKAAMVALETALATLNNELAVVEAQIASETVVEAPEVVVEVVAEQVDTTNSEYTVEQLQGMKATEVKEVAKSVGIAVYSKEKKKAMTKAELIAAITGTEVIVAERKSSKKKTGGIDFAKWMRDITENY